MGGIATPQAESHRLAGLFTQATSMLSRTQIDTVIVLAKEAAEGLKKLGVLLSSAT